MPPFVYKQKFLNMFDFNDLSFSINIINSGISSDNRKKRKKVLEDLTHEVSKYNPENPQLCVLFESVRQVLWRCVNDPAESVRDAVLDLLKDLFYKIPSDDKYLEEIIPIILYRLEEQEHREVSEELRLKLIQLLNIILEKNQNNIHVFAGDIIHALSQSLLDSFPNVRQESAKSCKILAQIDGVMYENGCKLVKPILTCFKHKHSKTRSLAIEALAAVLKEANWKNIEGQLVFGSLGEKLFDDSPAVRLAVVELLGCWFLNLRDRYSFFGRLIPLILSCLVDIQPEISSKAWEVWDAAGLQYLTENEQELKDRVDFLDEQLEHYPPGVKRPNLGCRTLVQRHICQMTSPLTQELSDWQPEVCVKASSLLYLLVLHAEAEVTQHAENLLLVMYRVAENKGGDVPPECQDNVEKAAEYMGYFVSPATWHQLIYPIVEAEPSSGNLFVLSALLRGSRSNSLDPYADRLAEILADCDVCESLQTRMQLETLKCCRALLDNVTNFTEKTIKNLLCCLYHVTSATSFVMENALLTDAGRDCLCLLAEKAGTTVEKLSEGNMELIIMDMELSIGGWSTAHPKFRLLLFILGEPAANWFPSVDKIFKILKEVLQLDKGDVAVKSLLFGRLESIYTNYDSRQNFSNDAFQKFSLNAVEELIIPNLTWRAGRSAESLRTCVLSCLCHIIRKESEEIQMDLPHQKLVPALIACIQDTPTSSRKLALECLDYVIKMAAIHGHMSSTLAKDIYPQVVNRLDDVDNDVREMAIKTLQTFFETLPKEMTGTTHSAIFDHLVGSMLPYLDDENESVRNKVCETLKTLTSRAPTVIKAKLTSRVHLFKSQQLCTDLMDLCTNVLASQ